VEERKLSRAGGNSPPNKEVSRRKKNKENIPNRSRHEEKRRKEKCERGDARGNMNRKIQVEGEKIAKGKL